MSQLSPETKAKLDENANELIQQLNISLTKDGNLSPHVSEVGKIGEQAFKDLQATYAQMEPKFSKAKTPLLRAEVLREGLGSLSTHLTGLQEAIYQLKSIEFKMKDVLHPSLFPNSAIQIQEFKKFIDVKIQHTSMTEKSLVNDMRRYKTHVEQADGVEKVEEVKEHYKKIASKFPNIFKESNQVRDVVNNAFEQMNASLEEPRVSKETLEQLSEQILKELDKKRVLLDNTPENSFSKLNEKIQELRDNLPPNTPPQVKKNM